MSPESTEPRASDLYSRPAPLGGYVLDGRTPRPATSLGEWADFFENHDARRVAHSTMGDKQVITMFIGVDESFGGRSPPLLFGTVVRVGETFGAESMSATWEEAEAEHARVVAATFT